jgi:hypothetical protein
METGDWIGDPAEIDRDREYVALVTRLPRDQVPTTARYLRHVTALRSDLDRAPGLVGHTFRADIVKREYESLSVWTDEDALRRFAGRSGNGRGGEDTASDAFPSWRIAGRDLPPSWEEAKDRFRGDGP